jgi:ankyrin repeat protein
MATREEIIQKLVDEFVGAAHGDFEKVKAMLAEYPDLIDANASWNELAIEAAAQTGRVDIANYLLAAGAPLDICTAAMLGEKEKVLVFLDQDPGASQARGAHGIPILYYPAIRNQREVADLLLSRGAQVNAGEFGYPPIHGAVLFNQVEMVRWLLNHGADRNLKDYDGRTPLERATENKQQEMVEILKSS